MGNLYDRLQAIRERKAALGAGENQPPPAREPPPADKPAGETPFRDAGKTQSRPAGGSSQKTPPANTGVPRGAENRSTTTGNTPAEGNSPRTWTRTGEDLWERSFVVSLPDVPELRNFAAGVYEPGRIYLDTETTGLSTGAGTHAFLIGWTQWLSANQVIVRQCFMADPAAELNFIRRVEALWDINPRDSAGPPGPEAATVLAGPHMARAAESFASYNGASFDLPLLRSRWIMNGLQFPERPHRDYLYPARRSFKRLIPACGLKDVERFVFGIERQGDVPGELIPAMYFDFLRTGRGDDFESFLRPVFDHHAQDIFSLALLGRLIDAVETSDFATPDMTRIVDPEAIADSHSPDGRASQNPQTGNFKPELRSALSRLARAEAVDRFSNPLRAADPRSNPIATAGPSAENSALLHPKKVFPVFIDERSVYRILSDRKREAEFALSPDDESPCLSFARGRWLASEKPEWGTRLVYELRRRNAAGRPVSDKNSMEIRTVLESMWKNHGDLRAARALGNIYEHVFRDVDALAALHSELGRSIGEARVQTGDPGRSQLSEILARRIERLGGRLSGQD